MSWVEFVVAVLVLHTGFSPRGVLRITSVKEVQRNFFGFQIQHFAIFLCKKALAGIFSGSLLEWLLDLGKFIAIVLIINKQTNKHNDSKSTQLFFVIVI